MQIDFTGSSSGHRHRRALALFAVLLGVALLYFVSGATPEGLWHAAREIAHSTKRTYIGEKPPAVVPAMPDDRFKDHFAARYLTPEAKKLVLTDHLQREFTVEVLAENLASPDGLAIHPLTGDLYVSEEDAARIGVIDAGRIQEVIGERTPVHQRGMPAAPLQSPEGIAFSSGGELYVVEDRPGGRLLRFDNDFRQGEVIPIAGAWGGFAWEGVDVSPAGEILLAGSNMESAAGREGLSPFTGVILYRDTESNWWIVHESLFSSFSGVQFSKSRKHAVYVCEALGQIGWLDLTTRRNLGGNSAYLAHMPESVCVLPNGMLLVAEEGGTLVCIDPGSQKHEELASNLGSIETVVWDAAKNRALVTEDGAGRVLELRPDKEYPAHFDAMDFATYHPAYTPRHIPPKCPDYLASVLALGGLDFRAEQEPDVSFRRFTARVPLIAADARAVPILSDSGIEDPIERVQFVVFRPNQVALEENGGAAMPLAGFVALLKSGKIIQTSKMRVAAYFSSFDTGGFEPMDLSAVVVPYPGAVSVSSLGIATIQFLGMGQLPDYSLVLNPRHPYDSYMVVFNNDARQHYRLEIPGDTNEDDPWVIAVAGEVKQEWTLLGTGTGEARETAEIPAPAVKEDEQITGPAMRAIGRRGL